MHFMHQLLVQFVCGGEKNLLVGVWHVSLCAQGISVVAGCSGLLGCSVL